MNYFNGFSKGWKAAVAAMLVAAAFVFAACDQGVGGSSGKGTLRVDIKVWGLEAPQTEIPAETPDAGNHANILRTVFPTIPSDTFTKYGLSFDPGGGGQVITEEITSGTTGTFTLKAATYTVTVTGYNSGDTPIALGKVEGVSVTDGGTTPVSIELGPITEGSPAPGTFAYTVTINDGLSLDDSSKLYVTTAADTDAHIDINGNDAGTDITVTNTGAASSVSLPPGYYRVWIELKESDTEAEAGLRGEVMHIYSGLTSSFTQSFGAGNFGVNAVVNEFELSSLFDYPAAGEAPDTELDYDEPGAQYTGAISWKITGGADITDNFAAETAYTAIVSLEAKTGWTFTGVEENTFTYDADGKVLSITNEAGDGATLTVTVSFAATPPVTGYAGITVQGIPTTEMEVTGYNPPVGIAKTGAPVTWSVEGYGNVTWELEDGTNTTAASFVINPASYAVRTHIVVVTGTKNGIPYSRTLEFTITGTGGGGNGVVDETPKAIAEINAYLASLPDNPTGPLYKITIAADETGIKTSYVTLAAALNVSGKNVFLDLSLVPANNLAGYGESGGYLAGDPDTRDDRINMTVGILSNLKGIGLPTSPKEYIVLHNRQFQNMSYLEEVVIPANITKYYTAKAFVFTDASNIRKITILGATEIKSENPSTYKPFSTVPGGTGAGTMQSVYSAANPKNGVYEFNGTAWSKTE